MATQKDLTDRIAVADVMVRYARCIDERDWDGLETCFSPDAVSVLGDGPRLEGYPAILEAIRGVIDTCRATHHLVSNFEVEPDGDRARLRANLIATHLTETGRFVVGGVYREEMTRTAEGWRIYRHQLDTLWVD